MGVRLEIAQRPRVSLCHPIHVCQSQTQIVIAPTALRIAPWRKQELNPTPESTILKDYIDFVGRCTCGKDLHFFLILLHIALNEGSEEEAGEIQGN